VEVLDGLEAGDLVIYDGHFALADGSPVNLDDEEARDLASDASP
jgi:hypothetical protein